MPKAPVLTSKQISKLLEKAGFVFDRSRGSHHIYFRLKDKKRVVVPFHGKDMPKGTALAILKEAGISYR